MRGVGATAVAIASVVVALTACTKTADTIDLTSPTPTSVIGGPGSVTEWLGVLRAEAVVDNLDGDTAAVKAIVGGSIVVSPVACFDGLPASFEPDVYVLGVVAPTRQELDRLLSQVGRSTIFEGQVHTMCLD
jgi:hypothetical protein